MMKTLFRLATLATLATLSLALLPLLPVAPASAQYNGLPVAGTTGFNASAYRGLRRQQRGTRRYNNTRRTGTGTRTGANNGSRANTTKAPAKPKVDITTELGKLGLTAAQKSKVGIYQAKADADGKAAYADRTLSPDEFIARMDKIHEELMASIDSVLTGEQKTKFDAAMAKGK